MSVLEPSSVNSKEDNPYAETFKNTKANDLEHKKNDYLSSLFKLYLDIETRFLSKERVELDLAETTLIFIKN